MGRRKGGREGGRGSARNTYVLLILGQAVVRALGEFGDLFQEHLSGLLGFGGQLGDDVLLELTTLLLSGSVCVDSLRLVWCCAQEYKSGYEAEMQARKHVHVPQP